MTERVLIPKETVRNWGVEILAKAGLSIDESHTIMDVLIHANLRGVDTHGIIKIILYSQRAMKIKSEPLRVISDEQANCLIDGGDKLGPIPAKFAMGKAIEKASIYGCGSASVRNSNHYGTAAYYALMAAEKGMLGFSVTNASGRIAPWGGLDGIIGNNPWSIALPGVEFPIVLDMANTVVANGKIRECKQEGKQIPDGWAMDSEGNPTNDPDIAMKGLLMPIGGYKGVGISVMMDILAGAISQNGFSNKIQRIDDTDKTQKVGHFFIAIRLEDFLTPEMLRKSIEEYTETFKSVRLKAGCSEVFLPGEIEWRLEKERTIKGIPFSRNTLRQLNVLADNLDVFKLYEDIE